MEPRILALAYAQTALAANGSGAKAEELNPLVERACELSGLLPGNYRVENRMTFTRARPILLVLCTTILAQLEAGDQF